MTKAVVVVGFIVAFAAGLVVGVVPRPEPSRPTTRPSRHGGWLTAELNLSPEQQEQLNKIWSETAFRGGRDRDDRRRRLFKERDEAIAALIHPEDKAQYEEVLRNHSEQMAAMDREWRAAFDASVERTKEILTPEQRAKYDDLLQRRQQERGSYDRRHGDKGRENGRGSGHHAMTRPTARP